MRGWLDGLNPAEFATVAFNVDRLAERGSTLRMPYSRSLGEGLFRASVRPRAARTAHHFFFRDRRIVLLTVFRKHRSNERAEVARARTAMGRCIEQSHTAHE